jgi:hypothetical protein
VSESVPKGLVQPQNLGEDPLTHWTRVFAQFLQLVFASFSKGAYHWEQDDRLTEIVIQDQGSIKKEVVEKRPAIVLSRGPMQYGNLVMDQFAGPSLTVPNEEYQYGRRHYTDLIATSMSYNCLSREGIEAGRLAHICAMSTRRLKRVLLHAGMHRVGEEISVGAESPPGAVVQPDSNEIVMVTVSVPFYYQDYWTIEPVDKLLLKNVDLALRSEVRLNPPSIYGRSLVSSLTQELSVGDWTAPKPLK